MAAPSYVPVDPTEDPRDYESPPRRPDSWWATRPGEVIGAPQPRGTLLGNQGPDQGYALKLVHLFADKIRVTEGESVHDAEAGCRRAWPRSGRRCSAGRRPCTTSPSASRCGASSTRARRPS